MKTEKPLSISAERLRQTFCNIECESLGARLEDLGRFYTPATVASLEVEEVLRMLDTLDGMGTLINAGNGQHGSGLQDMRGLALMLAAIRKSARRGIAQNTKVTSQQLRGIASLIEQTTEDRLALWLLPRGRVMAGMQNEYEKLQAQNPAFFRLRTEMDAAADDYLACMGMVPLGRFWGRRLMLSLYSPLKPVDARMKLFSPVREGQPEKQTEETDEESYMALSIFHARVRDSLYQMPDFLHMFLDESGYQFRLGLRLRDIDPEYASGGKSAQPVDFEADSSGVHIQNELAIDIPLFSYECRNGKWIVTQANETRVKLNTTIAHETYHAMDAILDDFSMKNPFFAQAYADDVAALRAAGISADDMNRLEYYLAREYGGVHPEPEDARAEAFAELGAEVSLGYGEHDIHYDFPQTACEVQRLRDTLRWVYAECPDGSMFLKVRENAGGTAPIANLVPKVSRPRMGG